MGSVGGYFVKEDEMERERASNSLTVDRHLMDKCMRGKRMQDSADESEGRHVCALFHFLCY